MRYIIYTRVSSNKQTVENQLHECREYVYKRRHKSEQILEFCEPDKSTMRPMSQRKKLIEMMSHLRRGDMLVVYKVDRLARDKQELINIFCDIKKMGVEICGIKDPNLSDETILMYAMIASHERKNIQDRTVSGLKRKMANGERVGVITYGYTIDPTKIQNTRRDVNSFGKPYLLLPSEDEQKQVSLMEEMYRLGASYGDIAHELFLRGYRNRKGNPVHKSTVFRVLKRLEMQNPSPGMKVSFESHEST